VGGDHRFLRSELKLATVSSSTVVWFTVSTNLLVDLEKMPFADKGYART
jgi:hypothetical protein